MKYVSPTFDMTGVANRISSNYVILMLIMPEVGNLVIGLSLMTLVTN